MYKYTSSFSLTDLAFTVFNPILVFRNIKWFFKGFVFTLLIIFTQTRCFKKNIHMYINTGYIYSLIRTLFKKTFSHEFFNYFYQRSSNYFFLQSIWLSCIFLVPVLFYRSHHALANIPTRVNRFEYK